MEVDPCPPSGSAMVVDSRPRSVDPDTVDAKIRLEYDIYLQEVRAAPPASL